MWLAARASGAAAASPGFLPARHSGGPCSGLDPGALCFLKGSCFSWARMWVAALAGPTCLAWGGDGGGDTERTNQGLSGPGLSSPTAQLSFRTKNKGKHSNKYECTENV